MNPSALFTHSELCYTNCETLSQVYTSDLLLPRPLSVTLLTNCQFCYDIDEKDAWNA